MVREARLAWNDPDEQAEFRNLPVDDDTEDWDESPLEPPPKRRCSKRRRNTNLSRTDPTGSPESLPDPPEGV